MRVKSMASDDLAALVRDNDQASLVERLEERGRLPPAGVRVDAELVRSRSQSASTLIGVSRRSQMTFRRP